ncbi:MAG: glycosyltransferase family 2 protein [Rhodothermales bacterium]
MKISVLIGTRNRPALLQRCIKSVLSQSYKNIEIWVLDDASSPAINQRTISALSKTTPIRCIRADQQLGLNAVRNRLLKAATGDLFFIIDDDAFFDADHALQSVVNTFKTNQSLGIIATKILDSRSGAVKPLTPHSRRHIKKDPSILDDQHLISYFLGGAHAIRRSVIETCGNFDEVLMYGLDEIELAYRALGHGYEIQYLPEVIVHHQPPPPPKGAQKESPWRLYYLTRNRILFAYKHLPLRYTFSYIPGWLCWYGYKAAISGLLPVYFKGIRDGIKTTKHLERQPVNNRTIGYLKANFGRLWR